MNVTIDDVLAWQPCDPPYNRERVTELFAGRKTVTALDVLDMDIPDEDKLWAVLREDLILAPILHELACRYAELAFGYARKAGHEPHSDSIRAVEAKRAWVRGEISGDDLRAAQEAAQVAQPARVTRVAWVMWGSWGVRAVWVARAAWKAAQVTRTAWEVGHVAREVAQAAQEAAREAVCEAQVQMVREILQVAIGGSNEKPREEA